MQDFAYFAVNWLTEAASTKSISAMETVDVLIIPVVDEGFCQKSNSTDD